MPIRWTNRIGIIGILMANDRWSTFPGINDPSREGESLKDSGGQCSVTSSDEDEAEPIEQMDSSLVSISWIGIRLGRVCSIPRFDILSARGEREEKIIAVKRFWLKVNEGLTPVIRGPFRHLFRPWRYTIGDL